MGGFVKSVAKTVGDIVTFGAVSRHDAAKAQRKQAEAQRDAARIQSEAQKKQLAAQTKAMKQQAAAQEKLLQTQKETQRQQQENADREAEAAKVAAANIPQEQQEAVSASIRDEEANKIKRRRGMTGTILTSALGTTGTVQTGSNKLGVF